MLEERIVSRESLDVLSYGQSATYIGDVAYHAILLFVVFRQLLVTFVIFSKKTLADDGVDFLSVDVNAFVETVGHLRDGITVDLCRIDNIIELLLGNADSPDMLVETP